MKIGEALVELETDKINFEVEAEQDGVLESISKGEGETVGVGDVIGTIGEGEADKDGAAPAAESEEAAEEEDQPRKSLLRRVRRPSSPSRRPARGGGGGGQRSQGGRGRWPPGLALGQQAGPGVRHRPRRGLRLGLRWAHHARRRGAPDPGAVQPGRAGHRGPPEDPEGDGKPRAEAGTAGAAGRGRAGRPRGAGAGLPQAPDHRPAARRVAADGGHAHHLQRGGHERGHGAQEAPQGGRSRSGPAPASAS